MKKAGKYVILSLLLLLGLGCVGVLYLFFIPNSTLFNIKYINLNEKVKSFNYNISNVSNIYVNSRAYEVNLLPSNTNSIYVEVYSNSFGFVHKDHSSTRIDSTLKNGNLTFDIKEPYGFATKNSSYIRVYIPESSEVNVNLSNKKATTNIDSPTLKIKDLNYSTSKGQFNFYQGEITGSLKLNLNKSKFIVHSKVKTNNNNVEIKMTTAKFIASDSTFGNISIIENERGVINVHECITITANNENMKTAGGQININKINSQANIRTGDTILTFGEVENATIDILNSGSVSIGTLNALSYITTNTGNIHIEKCEGPAVLHTYSGNITIPSAKKKISVQTTTGSANITFSEDADHYSPTDEYPSRILYARIYNGTLIAKGVEHVGVSNNANEVDFEGIKVTGVGKVDITMNNVCGENEIIGNNGNVNVVVNYQSIYTLTTSSVLGNVRVNLLQTSNFNGYTSKLSTQTNVNCNTISSNLLNVSTHRGNLTLLDSMIYANGF